MRWNPRFHGQVGDDQHAEDEEGGDAHGPGEADLGNQALHEDGEDDASERGAGGHDAKGKGAASEEPGADGGHGRVEDGGGAEGREDALGEDELVVFGGKRGHHEAEDVQEAANEEEVAGAVTVVDFTHYGTAEEHHEGFEGRDP